MTYFYPLYFVMGVCKQQQMSSQFAKAFGDALLGSSPFVFSTPNILQIIINTNTDDTQLQAILILLWFI